MICTAFQGHTSRRAGTPFSRLWPADQNAHIENLMRRVGIYHLPPKALQRQGQATDTRHGFAIASKLLGRNFTIAQPN